MKFIGKTKKGETVEGFLYKDEYKCILIEKIDFDWDDNNGEIYNLNYYDVIPESIIPKYLEK